MVVLALVCSHWNCKLTWNKSLYRVGKKKEKVYVCIIAFFVVMVRKEDQSCV